MPLLTRSFQNSAVQVGEMVKIVDGAPFWNDPFAGSRRKWGQTRHLSGRRMDEFG
jgi:hypothetical protein